jgi:hypothetical protein
VIIRCYSNCTFPQLMLLIWIAGMMWCSLDSWFVNCSPLGNHVCCHW